MPFVGYPEVLLSNKSTLMLFIDVKLSWEEKMKLINQLIWGLFVTRSYYVAQAAVNPNPPA
jgi:hypothetical protein